MTEPLDLEPICARITSGYDDEPPDERLDHAIDDAAQLVSEVERLRAEIWKVDDWYGPNGYG